MRFRSAAAAFAMVFIVAGCSRNAALYPINDAAILTGPLGGHNFANRIGSGQIQIQMPDGELLEGEYAVRKRKTVKIGDTIATISELPTPSLVIIPASPQAKQCTALLTGTLGTTMRCEFYANPSGSGVGTCEMSNGALYHLSF